MKLPCPRCQYENDMGQGFSPCSECGLLLTCRACAAKRTAFAFPDALFSVALVVLCCALLIVQAVRKQYFETLWAAESAIAKNSDRAVYAIESFAAGSMKADEAIALAQTKIIIPEFKPDLSWIWTYHTTALIAMAIALSCWLMLIGFGTWNRFAVRMFRLLHIVCFVYPAYYLFWHAWALFSR